MTDKEFRWLRRADLIEIIYALQESEKELRLENDRLKKQLDERNFMVEHAGSLAEISAHLTGIFEAAQATADEYLALIKSSQSPSEADSFRSLPEADEETREETAEEGGI